MQKLTDWRQNRVRGLGLGLDLQELGSGFSTTVCSDGGLLFRTAIVLRVSFVKSPFSPFPAAAEDGAEGPGRESGGRGEDLELEFRKHLGLH